MYKKLIDQDSAFMSRVLYVDPTACWKDGIKVIQGIFLS